MCWLAVPSSVGRAGPAFVAPLPAIRMTLIPNGPGSTPSAVSSPGRMASSPPPMTVGLIVERLGAVAMMWLLASLLAHTGAAQLEDR